MDSNTLSLAPKCFEFRRPFDLDRDDLDFGLRLDTTATATGTTELRQWLVKTSRDLGVDQSERSVEVGDGSRSTIGDTIRW